MPNNKSSELALETVTALADDIVQKLGMSLVDIHFGQAGRQKSMEVIIYRKGGKVSLSDCEQVSRELDQKLEQLQDTIAFFHGPYVLDVGSPGIYRILKSEREFDIFRGLQVEVKTKTTVCESSLGQHFIGTLEKMGDDAIHLSSLKPAPQKTFGTAAKGNKKISHKKVQLQETIKALVVPLKQVIEVKLYPEVLKNLKALQEETADGQNKQETDITI